MKTVGFIYIALFMSLAMGSTLESIQQKVKLNYDRNHDNCDHLEFKSNNYLTTIREEIVFPKGSQHLKLDKAIDLLDEIMNSEEFKHRVISYIQPDGTPAYQKSYLWQDEFSILSREEVYKIIMQGWERMRPNTEGEMNINIKKYYKPWSRVIGWTSPSSSKWINVNWRFYKRYDVHEMVGNIVHEWIHLLGFLHGSEKLHQEVPYVVGSIAAQIAKEVLATR